MNSPIASPVNTFVGHSDVVLEFQWRSQRLDGERFSNSLTHGWSTIRELAGSPLLRRAHTKNANDSLIKSNILNKDTKGTELLVCIVAAGILWSFRPIFCWVCRSLSFLRLRVIYYLILHDKSYFTLLLKATPLKIANTSVASNLTNNFFSFIHAITWPFNFFIRWWTVSTHYLGQGSFS